MDPPRNGLDLANKLLLTFPLLSDPQGELAKLYGLWNEKESIAVPSIVALDKSGTVRSLYAGEDFADRPRDEELFRILDEIGGGEVTAEDPEVRVPATDHPDSVRPDRRPMSLEDLIMYYRGVYFTTIALKRRFGDRKNKDALRAVSEYQEMIQVYRRALDETVRLRAEG